MSHIKHLTKEVPRPSPTSTALDTQGKRHHVPGQPPYEAAWTPAVHPRRRHFMPSPASPPAPWASQLPPRAALAAPQPPAT